MKVRKRKPFNPMLGETYEMVTEKYRFVAEKIEHQPKQIFCYKMEGEHYTLWGYQCPKPKLGFNGGRGQMQLNQLGINDIYFSKFDEHISLSKPQWFFKNLFFGGMYVDVAGNMDGLSLKTNCSIKCQMHEKASDSKPSHITAQIFNADGIKKGELSGSWLSELIYRDNETGATECLWKIPPLLDNAYYQYMFTHFTLQMNYFHEQMRGIVPPTDSRYRGDIRFYEEGQIDQSELEKVAIEVRQRTIRRWVAEGKIEPWKPRFFKEIPHPYVQSNDVVDSKEEKPIMYELIEGEKGYWERRANKDWADMPNLWGPWKDIESINEEPEQ